MKVQRLSYAALACGALIGASQAQLDDALICDATNGRVYRTQDLDGDELISGISECVLFFEASDLQGFDTGAGGVANPATLGIVSVQARDENGTAAVYWSSGFGAAADAVGRGTDLNGDGRIGAEEMTLFWDAGGQGFDIDPDGLTLTSDGAVWVSSDFDTHEGVWRLEDTTGDGVADVVDQLILGSGFTVGYGADGVAPGSNSAASGDDFQWLTAIGGGAVIGYEGFSSAAASSEDCIFRLEDQNGDGDLADGYGDGNPLNDEARLFLNYIGKNPAYPVNPDFGTVLRDPEVDPSSGTTGSFVRLMHTAYVNDAGAESYYFASETSSTSAFNLNVNSLALNGLIYKGVDNNNDNDVNDAGEVTLFYDGSNTGPMQGMDKILGMRGVGDWVYVLDLAFGGKSVHRFRDANGDGDAMDVGEAEFHVFDATTYNPLGIGVVPPFTDPAPPVYTLDPAVMSLPIGFVTTGSAMPAGLFPYTNGWFEVTGQACSTFGGPLPRQSMFGLPRVDSLPGGSAPPMIVSVSNTGSAAGDIVIMYGATNATTYSGVPLPLDLSIFSPLWTGCSLYVNPQFPNLAVANGAGVASVSLGLPNQISLIGAPLYTQWLNLSSNGVPGAIFSLSGLGTFIVQQ
ncbi:MAG: hypothetical protein WD226_08705 [Planctomycetota bacterium]